MERLPTETKERAITTQPWMATSNSNERSFQHSKVVTTFVLRAILIPIQPAKMEVAAPTTNAMVVERIATGHRSVENNTM